LNIFWNIGLVSIHHEDFYFSFNYECFGEYSNLGPKLFSFSACNTSFGAILAFKISVEESAVILMGLP
jgi:hypothetical protein